MDPISPALTDAFDLLRTDLDNHLSETEALASKASEWSWDDIDVARKLIPDLVVIIRGLLIEHGAQPSGECLLCSSAWPCPVVTTIHALVKDPDRQFVALLRRANIPPPPSASQRCDSGWGWGYLQR